MTRPHAWNSTLPLKREKPRRSPQETPKGGGATVLHRGPFRASDLLSLAALAPHCMNCGVVNVGQVVACHSNHLRHGKGMGQKAHDLPAYLCGECHSLLDGRAGNLNRAEKDVLFLESAYKTILWLLQSNHLKVAA